MGVAAGWVMSNFFCRFKEYEKPKQTNKFVKNSANQNPKFERNFNNAQPRDTSHNYSEEVIELEESFDNMFAISDDDGQFARDVNNVDSRPIKMKLMIKNNEMSIEVDTGSPISAISSLEYEKNPIFSKLMLMESSGKFKAFTGAPIIPLGVLKVNVEYQGRLRILEFFVIPGSNGPILGRQWIRALEIPLVDNNDGMEIKKVLIEDNLNLNSLIKDFSTIFTDEVGLFKEGNFKLELKDNSKPISIKPRL